MLENQKHTIEDMRVMENTLRMKLYRDGKIEDFEKGYLFLPWVTDTIDTTLQHYAAISIVHQLRQRCADNYDGVISVPFMGTYLAVPVSEELQAPLIVARKGKFVPHTWEHPLTIPNKMTNNGTQVHHSYNILPGKEVLLVDDMLGDGDTIIPVIEHMRNHGVVINNIAAYVIKLYRPGYERLIGMGVQPFGSLYIETLTAEGNIVLAPPKF